MKPTERGAFCSACQKTVIDYTQATPAQLRDLLKQKQPVCGKFKPELLDVPITKPHPKWYSKLGLYLGVSSLFLISPSIFSQVQHTPQPTRIAPTATEKENGITNPEPVLDSIRLEGIVSDANWPLPGVNIFLKGRSEGVISDFDGRFSITIPKTVLKHEPMLICSSLGYETKELTITDLTQPIKIELSEELVTMGEVVVVKQNVFHRIRNWFR
ncbi:carboxypeptidase-like regulatory domain-containing protein [Formosa algae]|uniref:carboxypeptidase-like regulatory domain-containing protein n=1 Tax=Formosa algae TaxID=225843 RepID=UPI000CCDCFCB|nr:carboxypeptidase-like regulatory domain-containing protein [Formosa algae]PNW29712.1 hypothetical protein BKP44_03175 [Formosa algae]